MGVSILAEYGEHVWNVGRRRLKNRDCVYPESKDNASSSRQFAATLDARCQQMDALCQRMDQLMGKFTEIAESLGAVRPGMIPPIPDPSSIDLMPDVPPEMDELLPNDDDLLVPEDNEMIQDSEQMDDDPAEESESSSEPKPQDHVMTTDSYGKLRYVGGTGAMVMIEALKSLSPESAQGQSPDDLKTPEKSSISRLELPFFVRGQTWPRLPYLPQPDQLVRPPRYISDLLINLYFDQLHYIMPIIYKPHFMQRYNILLNTRAPANLDAGFLSVFFAVCACASGILPREPGNSSVFTGLQYYESALLLHYASTGEGSIEQVQCLALLSVCSAGWNTLAQSWKWGGQAVRAAQDLGLHRSPARGSNETLKEELCRRVWWSVYGLDRLLSVCLGRPVAVEDADCDCEIPLDLDDDELAAHCRILPEQRPTTIGPSRMSGFIAFSRLCQISAKIVRAMNPLKSRRKRRKNTTEKANAQKLVDSFDLELVGWLQSIPDSIKFSANSMDAESGPDLTWCVILYIVHAGCLINLHRPLIPDMSTDASLAASHNSYAQCTQAARSCIRAAELIQERVPPSHHLAFCTHYLALSGVFLVRSSSALQEDYSSDIEACLLCLTRLETVWSGARRSKLILEELLKHSGNQKPDWSFQYFGSDDLEDFVLQQDNPDFTFDGMDTFGEVRM
ncbi:hypothetical protein BP6252_06068 [Coleophoma cylindrospora]|uniref:Xylanolytic transcriptional activator regulatory domain-containing protein n=1 Tax=Coleophoma cylindrospora TaxID=1849047 RepID=A0A3D8RLW1_9HELO|nr:hypothetical protein BP6252_06068 [Coleophoma cylindrospora]